MMHVLTYHGQPIAAADRFERLNAHVADSRYTAEQQAAMSITGGVPAMTVARANIEFAKRIFTDRLGDDYVYGGTWDPFDLSVGCDCSGLVTDILSAVFHGTDMIWGREGLSTESYRYKPLGPQRVGVFDLVHVASPAEIPADAAVRIDLHHEGAGGPDSHMHCVVDGVVMESNGDHGTCTLPQAISPASTYWNDFWFVPGPIDGTAPPPPPGDSMRPDFNEYPMWSPNSSGRGGTKVDLFLLHTQEGPGNADSLARFLQGHEVSYHYTISEDPGDHGVTVVDVVDTDSESWSVLSANPRSINLCFAGSRADWSRDQWLQQSRAIDVAAYLAVQDCKKYGIPLRVLKPPYGAPGGISDHRYVTKFLGDGTHVDVGGPMAPPWTGFPWDVFETAVNKYANQPATPTPGGSPVPAPNVPDYTKETWDQIRGRWAMLGGQTLVEALAQVRDKVCGTADAGKPGVKFD